MNLPSMMREQKQQSFYEVLDVSMSAKPEMIRTAYIRAKNTYARDSLAVYTLFEPEESRRILEQIEEAYNVLSDPERRRKYDEAHGFMSIDTEISIARKPTEVEVRAVAESERRFQFDQEPEETETTPSSLSAIDRIQSAAPQAAVSTNALSPTSFSTVKPYKVQREHETNSEMEEKIKRAENITGSFLKTVREYKRASIEEIMEITKISKNYIVALEADEVKKLPAAVYVRGFVAQYAKALGLESDRIAASYMSFFKSQRP